jgi:LAO/AO transport system kinase
MADGGCAAALYEKASRGDVAALARLLSLADSAPAEVAAAVWSQPGRAYVIGITGAPGAGKSTLTSALIRQLRAADRRVAVLAVDPSSPVSGGAILGDRIRMSEHLLDRHVFIRSLATRGSGGGLSAASPLAVRVLEAVGFSHVLVETVGVGQVELDIASYADTVVVVLNPRWGDGIQASKAGILEIGDVFAVNKADLPGASDTVAELRAALALGSLVSRSRNPGGEIPAEAPVVETVATEPRGIDALADAIDKHRERLSGRGPCGLAARRERRARDHLSAVITASFDEARRRITRSAEFEQAISEVATGRTDPWAMTARLTSPDQPARAETR